VGKLKNKKWFSPGVKMNWNHQDLREVRRRNALRAHGGDLLATARALQQLANVSQVGVVAKAARQDAVHFFAKYQSKKDR
jgi:REP element-mobilizing transposase RayT